MKRSKKKPFLALTLLLAVSASIMIIFHKNDKPNDFELRKISEIKSTNPNLVSYQIFQPTDQSVIDSPSKTEKKKSKVDQIKPVLVKTRLPARSTRRGEDPLSIYIDKDLGNFGVSTSVFAIPENIVLGSEYKVIANKLGMNWVQGPKKPENSLTVVKDSKTGKIGYYTGKILIIGKNSSVVKEFLDRSNESYNQISNTFIIELDNFENALEYAAGLRQGLPSASIDVDLNFSRMTTK